MPLKVHTLPCGEKYIISPKHRAARPRQDSCIWVIPHQAELDCFELAYKSDWFVNHLAWGISSVGINVLNQLGVNFQSHSLMIAKFTSNSKIWHGYPADNNNKPQDRPPVSILKKWLDSKLISKSLKARIQGGRL